MNGGKSYNDKLKDFEKILDEYTNGIGLSSIRYNNECEQIIFMSQKELESLTPQECNVNAFTLSQYALYIKKEYNRNYTRKKWAERHLDLIVASQASSYDKYTKYDVIRSNIINSDTAAGTLHNIILHAESRCSELEGLHFNIESMAEKISKLSYSNRREL